MGRPCSESCSEATEPTFPAVNSPWRTAECLSGSAITCPTRSAPSRHREEAAREYLGSGEASLSGLARLAASASTSGALLLGEHDQVRSQFAALASVVPELGDSMATSLDDYLRALDFIAALVAGPVSERPVMDAEAVKLLEVAASVSFENVPCATRLARAADAAAAAMGEPEKALSGLGRKLAMYRRWGDAVPVLEKSQSGHPEDRDVAMALASAWLELDRWNEARTLLVGMLSDPPVPQDVDVLQVLQNAAYRQRDQEYKRWQGYLAVIDPGADGGGPTARRPVSPAATGELFQRNP